MKVIVAKSAGFCFGVRRAVQLAEEAAQSCARLYTLGPIIHNRSVVEHLETLGVHAAGPDHVFTAGDTVIIRSHGVGRRQYEALKAAGVQVIDATCPNVEKIHQTVRKQSDSGRMIVIIGEREHPEVTGIADWCGRYVILETPQETEEYLFSHPEMRDLPLAVVSQTTGNRENFELCVKTIKKECTNAVFFDTICLATSVRQAEAHELAAHCDGMIVIGGKNSANSRRLAEICARNCGKVVFAECAADVCSAQFRGLDTVGITAGASTPAWIIKEVNQKMYDENKVTVASETAEGAVQETKPINETADEASFEELLEQSIKTLYTGEKVTGVVAAITPTEISVDLGTKQSGYIPIGELTDDPTAKAEDLVKVGDEIETYVMRVNDVEGTVMLSKKRLDSVKAWDDIVAARESKEPVEGYVTEENKGGLVVMVKGVRVFVPASQSGVPKDAPLTQLLKTKVRLRITEVNQARRRVVGSIRAVAYDERRAKAEAIWNEIEVGKHYTGTVKSLTSYGAFVDIGGIDGMVHVSELSWTRIHQPSDILKVGDQIDVFVLSFDKEKKKISLGCKNEADNPWTKFTSAYDVGSVASVRIVKLMPFGAFAEIIPGVDGLIHISQIADRRIGKPDEVLTVGETVNAKITEINNEKQKVSLSIRALLNGEADAPAADSEDAAE